ncbi:MAG: Ldh family oxidoreductase, partial [Cereibacter sp.]
DAAGRPTPAAPAPLAGSIGAAGGHQGRGLALLVEVLAAGLPGAHFSHQASSLGDDLGGPPRLGQTLIAIEPSGSGFAGRIEGLLADMTAEPGVRIPGDRRSANRRLTEAAGVTIDGDLMAQLRVLGGRL